MTPWISRVAVWVSWTFMLFCAVEILQVGSLNLALFTWFSWVWYIPKSCLLHTVVVQKQEIGTFLEQAGKPFAPKRWDGGFYLSLGAG